MIIENGHIDTVSNQSMVEFGLDNSSGHLFSVLSQLYSKPVESTIRELCTNCTDAHIMSNNQSKPFIIKLPNYEKNIYNFSIRDFGPGLSHDEIMNIYKWYGRSTKTNSNEVTGCLGLGSKSPYSISSTFYVKSYNNGKCSQYTCTMNNVGKPNISEFPIIFDTIEENGLEVIIPFYKEVNFFEILPRILKYFKVKPLVYLQMGDLEHDILQSISWFKNNEMYKLTDTIYVEKDNKSGVNLLENAKTIENEVVQLQIYYPLDIPLIKSTMERFNKLYTDENNNTIKNFKISDTRMNIILKLLNKGIQIHSKPGKIAFAPSRESIKYTDLTLIYIIKELNRAAKIYEKQFNTMFNNIDSYDKAFRAIYLGQSKYETVKKAGFIKDSSNIMDYKNLFSKITSVNKIDIFTGFNYNGKSYKIQEYGGIKFATDAVFSLNNNFGYLKSLFSDASYDNLSYYDLMSVDGNEMQETSNKIMITNFMTPFTKDLIRLCLNKLIYLTYIETKKSIKKDIEHIHSLSDKNFVEYNLENVDISYAYFSLEQDLSIKCFTKTDGRFNLNDALEQIDNLKFNDFINMCLRFAYKVIYFGENSKYNSIKLFRQMVYYINLSSVAGNYKSELKNLYFQNLSKYNDNDLLEAFNTLNPFKYKDFEIIFSYTYRRFVKNYLKNKKGILAKFNPIDFDNIPVEFLNVRLDDYSNDFSTQRHLLPFDNIIKIKSKEVVHILDSVSQYILGVYVQYYLEQFEEQINYSQQPKDADISKILHSFGIPKEYTLKIKNCTRILPTRRSTSSYTNRNTDQFSFKLVEPGNAYSNIITNLYKFDKSPDEEGIAELHEILREVILKIRESLKDQVLLFNEHKKLLNIKDTKDFLNSETREVLKNNFELKYYITLNEISNILKNIELPFLTLRDKYNTYIFAIRQLISIFQMSFIAGGYKDVLDKHPNIQHNLDQLNYFNTSSTDIKNIDYLGFYEKNTEEIESDDEDITIQTKKYFFMYQDNDFIFMNKRFANFEMSQQVSEEIFEEYFTKNKFILIDDLIKIGVGKSYFEEYNLKELSKIIPDSQTKKIRSEFTNRYTLELEKLINYFYPDFIVINNLDNIPVKYQKDVYNVLPFILNLDKTPVYKKILDLQHDFEYLLQIDSTSPMIPGVVINSVCNNSYFKKYNPNNKNFKFNIPKFKVLLETNGVAKKEFYSNQIRFMKLFTKNKKFIFRYKKLYIDLWKKSYNVLFTLLDIFYRNELKTINRFSLEEIIEKEIYANNNKFSNIKDIMKNFNHQMNILNSFRFSIIKLIRSRLDNEKDLDKFKTTSLVKSGQIEFEDDLILKFISDNVSFSYKKVSDGGSINITDLQNRFDKFLIPKAKDKEINIFAEDIDDFYRKFNAAKHKNVLNHKINKRTKERGNIEKYG